MNASGRNKVQTGYCKHTGNGQCHEVIDLGVIWKDFISWELSLYLLRFKVKTKVKVFCNKNYMPPNSIPGA